jgi:adenine-specific DNA methylase
VFGPQVCWKVLSSALHRPSIRVRLFTVRSEEMKDGAGARKTFCEFFAGIGLMRLGLEAAGWSVAFANDIDADKFAMYRTQFADAEDHFTLGRYP